MWDGGASKKKIHKLGQVQTMAEIATIQQKRLVFKDGVQGKYVMSDIPDPAS